MRFLEYLSLLGFLDDDDDDDDDLASWRLSGNFE